jgi:hypothetical protein
MQTLINKAEVAKRIGLTQRGVDCLVKDRRIPVVRISRKTIRFDWPKVEAALAGYEVKAITTGKRKGGGQ